MRRIAILIFVWGLSAVGRLSCGGTASAGCSPEQLQQVPLPDLPVPEVPEVEPIPPLDEEAAAEAAAAQLLQSKRQVPATAPAPVRRLRQRRLRYGGSGRRRRVWIGLSSLHGLCNRVPSQRGLRQVPLEDGATDAASDDVTAALAASRSDGSSGRRPRRSRPEESSERELRRGCLRATDCRGRGCSVRTRRLLTCLRGPWSRPWLWPACGHRRRCEGVAPRPARLRIGVRVG